MDIPTNEPQRSLFLMGIEEEKWDEIIEWLKHVYAMPCLCFDPLDLLRQVIEHPSAKDCKRMLEKLNEPKNLRKLKSRNFKIKGMNERKYLEMTRGD